MFVRQNKIFSETVRKEINKEKDLSKFNVSPKETEKMMEHVDQ